MRIFRSFLLLFLFSFCFLSCEKGGPECYEPVSILVRNQFVRKQILEIDSLINDTTLLDTTIISYRDTGLKAPAMFSLDMPQNIIVNGSKNATYLGIPLEPGLPSMRYVLQFDTAVAAFDTITYYYQTKNHFISNACGYTNNFHIDSIRISRFALDSFAVLKPDIVSGNEKQILLYFF